MLRILLYLCLVSSRALLIPPPPPLFSFYSYSLLYPTLTLRYSPPHSPRMIHFKFRSSLDYDSIAFEGGGLPVWELKKEIIALKKLASGPMDFDLIVTNAQTNEDYTEEYQIVPKNTSVIVRRVPSATGVRGGSKRAIAHSHAPTSTSTPFNAPLPTPSQTLTEEDRITSMISQSSAHWEKSSEELAAGSASAGLMKRKMRPFVPNNAGAASANPNSSFSSYATRPPPPTYTCFRCGQKGHYISACPTNDDPTFNVPRIKRTTGIPKTFLRPVENGNAGELASSTASSTNENVMISGEGMLVAAMPNEQMWQKMHASLGKDSSHENGIPPSLLCTLCERLMHEAVNVPCCSVCYCSDCIRMKLLDAEGEGAGEGSAQKKFTCPACGSFPVYPDALTANKAVRAACEEFGRTGRVQQNEQAAGSRQQSDSREEQRSEHKAEHRKEYKSDYKPDYKPEHKPDYKAEHRPEYKADHRHPPSEHRHASIDSKPDSKPSHRRPHSAHRDYAPKRRRSRTPPRYK